MTSELPPTPTACILGATGFIGGQISLVALAKGWRVRGLRRSPQSVGVLDGQAVEWLQGDLADSEALVRVMRGCDVVFHAAASYPQGARRLQDAVRASELEMRNVLDAAVLAGVRRLVYTSSLTTLGAPAHDARGEPIAADEGTFYARGSLPSAYYEAKAAMEMMVLARADELNAVVLLPTAVFGPGDVKPTTSVVVRDAGLGRIPVWFDATLNVVDGRDVAAAHLAAAERGSRGMRYIVGGTNVTLHDLLVMIAHLAHRPAPRLRVSRALVRALIRATDALPLVHIPDNFRMFEQWQPVNDARARRELGHTSRPLEDTIRDTLSWFGLPNQ